MKKLILFMVLFLGGVAFGQLPAGIEQGTVTVDGVIGADWSGVTWTAMDQNIYNSGFGPYGYDGTTGNIAMQWDDGANLVYLAVEYTDTDRNYGTIGMSGSWRAMDMVEIFWDGFNGNSNPYTDGPDALAQHYMVTGPQSGIDAAVHFDNYDAASASDYGGAKWVVTGDVVVLEIGLKPWEFRPQASHDLVAGEDVGLTVVINDRGDVANDTNHTWWSFVGEGHSSSDAGAFNDLELLPEPCTMVLLGIGGMSLIRRKKLKMLNVKC